MVKVTFWNPDGVGGTTYQDLLDFEAKLNGSSLSTTLGFETESLIEVARQINNIVDVCLQETGVGLRYAVQGG